MDTEYPLSLPFPGKYKNRKDIVIKALTPALAPKVIVWLEKRQKAIAMERTVAGITVQAWIYLSKRPRKVVVPDSLSSPAEHAEFVARVLRALGFEAKAIGEGHVTLRDRSSYHSFHI